MNRKALLVGINDYAPAGTGGPDLNGCVNDVRDMAHTLNALNIVPPTPASMKILTDVRATRAEIFKGLDWLLAGAKRGDVLIFFYSGHGSWVADVEGDEIDGKDETICPHDFATAGMIKDDDLRTLFARLPDGVNLDVILDSCHSGSGTRVLEALERLGPDEALTYRFIEPPLDYAYLVRANPAVPVRRFLKPHGREDRDIVTVPMMNHVLWAGCRDNQTSAEAQVEGMVRGIFTYCLCRALRRAGPDISRRRLDGLVGIDIRQMGYAQVPQLEGTKAALDEKVFT